MNVKRTIRNIFPASLFRFLQPFWHGFWARFGAFWFGKPSSKLVVIGVTGTNGKSTTVNLIAKILNETGRKSAYFSTVNWSDGVKQNLNTVKMTTPSGWFLQSYLSESVSNGCKYAVLEISSQGLEQNRHLGIAFDVVVFTNLTPEHIEAHGGFDKYKLAKLRLFKALQKNISQMKLGILSHLQRFAVVNGDDAYAEEFASAAREFKVVRFGEKSEKLDFKAENVKSENSGIDFQIRDTRFRLNLKGRFDVLNALAAVAVCRNLDVSLEECSEALGKLDVVAGRMEVLQTMPFTVVVDYAPEPFSLTATYGTLLGWEHNKIIQVLGSTGGGRDVARRPVLGEIAGKNADFVIVTNEDPYDDDPMQIIDDVAAGSLVAGKILDVNLFKILDRREAIRKAIRLCNEGDILLVSGKGSEQKMAVADGKFVDWDDRVVVREELLGQ